MGKTEAILESALKLFVQYGFHGTPTSMIAKQAGVSNGTLFHYYKTKDDLIIALYISIKDRLNGFLTLSQKGDDLKLRLENLFMDSIKWAQENPDEFYFIQQFHFSPHLSLVSKEEIERQTELHMGLLQKALKAKILKPLPLDFIATMFGNHIYGVNQYLTDARLTGKKRQDIISKSFELVFDMLTN